MEPKKIEDAPEWVEFYRNVYSQSGEDGLLAEIFRRIGTTNRWCFEVGAADGKWYSNTRKLLEEGWDAVLVEPDPAKWDELARSTAPFGLKAHLFNLAVGDAPPDDLDSILASAGCPDRPDLGVIDIDGQEWYVWNSLVRHHPRVVVVEFDPKAPPMFLPDRDTGIGTGKPYQGAGINVISNLAHCKGYGFALATGCNLICVDAEYLPLLMGDTATAEAVPKDKAMLGVRLNIGCGASPLPGYLNLDRKYGDEAVPLKIANTGNRPEAMPAVPGATFHGADLNDRHWTLADGCADEVRASHVLEHLSYGDVAKALDEWFRVLKPGGILRVAVPDAMKAAEAWSKGDGLARFYLMGGQLDKNDFHRSAFDEGLLRAHMEQAGFEDIKPWEGQFDTSTHPISLNLQGTKPVPKPEPDPAPQPAPPADSRNVTVYALVSRPRYGTNAFWDCVTAALRPFNIPLNSFTGVFWGQCMQRAFEEACDRNLDWILTLDYDSQFTAEHISRLFTWLGTRPDIDAIAALQCRRGKHFPLMTTPDMAGTPEGKVVSRQIDGQPILACSAHFGLTVLRTEGLKRMKKPWFWSTPDKDGGWGDGRLDDDIYFWHEWRKAGNTIYVAPDVRIGHIEEMVAEFDEEMKPRHVYVVDWRNANGVGKAKVTA